MQPARFRQANYSLVKINNAKSMSPAMGSGEERGLLSRTAAGNRGYFENDAKNAQTNQASLQCFLVHNVTSCGLVTSNGAHFHITASSSHLLASKVLFEGRKFISNIM